MSRQGFTLLETMLVLLLIVIIYNVVPKQVNTNTKLRYEVQTVKEILLQSKMKAIYNKMNTVVEIRENRIHWDEGTYELGAVSCGNHTVSFNPRGNVNLARTITCTFHQSSKDIIVYLGSGMIYVK